MAVDDVENPCPRHGCELPYSGKFKTVKSFQQKTPNITAAKTCYIPTTKVVEIEGEEKKVPAVMVVRHTYNDIAATEFDAPQWADKEGLRADEDPAEPGDLGENYGIVFEIIREATAEENSIKTRDLRPAAKEKGVEKDELYTILLNLIYHEFIVENTDAVFKVPPEVVV